MSGPLPVREYTDASAMLARYAELRTATFSPRDVPQRAPQFVSRDVRQAPKPIPAPDRAVTLLAFAEAQETVRRGRELASKHTKPMLDTLRIVCAVTGVPSDQLKSETRTAPIVRARQIAMFMMHRIGRHSLPEIGRYLGGRDHTTVLHGVKRADLTTETLNACSLDPVTFATELLNAPWRSARQNHLQLRGDCSPTPAVGGPSHTVEVSSLTRALPADVLRSSRVGDSDPIPRSVLSPVHGVAASVLGDEKSSRTEGMGHVPNLLGGASERADT